MQEFNENWPIATAFILLFGLAMPGAKAADWVPAMAQAAAFGAIFASLRPFCAYAGVPRKPAFLCLLSLIVCGAFIFWTGVIQPGFFISGASAFMLVTVTPLAIIVPMDELETRLKEGFRRFAVTASERWSFALMMVKTAHRNIGSYRDSISAAKIHR